MVPSLDEASTHYELIAETVIHPTNFASISFRLRAAARHHDGTSMLPCRTDGLIPINVDRTRPSLTVQRNIGKVAIGNE